MRTQSVYGCALAILVGAVVFVGNTHSNAAMRLTLSTSDALDTPIIVDDPGTSILYTNTTLFGGKFDVRITVDKFEDPISGELQTQTLDITNTSGADVTLYVMSSGNDFSFPIGPQLIMSSDFSGTFRFTENGNSATFQSFAASSNALDDLTDAYTDLQSKVFPTATTTGSFALPSETSPFNRTGDYSVTNVMAITLAAGARVNVSGTTTLTAIPEPGTFAMAITSIAMLSLAGACYRRKNV